MKNQILQKRGFTLVQVLVVLVVITILAVAVFAFLNTSEQKRTDSDNTTNTTNTNTTTDATASISTGTNDDDIKKNLANVSIQAKVYYGAVVGYSGVAIAKLPAIGCKTATSLFLDTTIAKAVTAITNANLPPICVVGGTNNKKASSWSMSATLKAGGSWCVDSTGAYVSGTDSNTDGDCGV